MIAKELNPYIAIHKETNRTFRTNPLIDIVAIVAIYGFFAVYTVADSARDGIVQGSNRIKQSLALRLQKPRN